VSKKILYLSTQKWNGNMIRGYKLVPWGKKSLLVEEAKQLFRNYYKYGWTLQAYLYTPRPCPQKGNLNEFIDRFKLLLIGI